MPIAISKKWLTILALLSFLACNSLFFTPGKDLPKVGDWFGEFSIDKLIHTALFCGMCFLFLALATIYYPHKNLKKSQGLIVLLFLLWAFATELIQLYLIDGRTGSVMDVLADAAGVVLAWLLLRKGLVQKIFKSRPPRRTHNTQL